MNNDRAKSIRSALLTAYNVGKAGGGKIIPHGDPQRNDNLAKFMRGSNRAVLNKDKSPKVFYHGTTVPDDFSEFSLGQPNYTEEEHGESYRRIYTHNDPTTYLGSHFAEEPEVANKFAKGLYGEAKDAKEGNRVIPVHLNIKKPLVTTESNMISSMLRHPYDHPDVEQQFNNDEDAERYYHPDEIDYRISKNKMALKLATEDDSSFAEQMAEKYKNRLIENGYDGVKYKNEVEGGNSWIAFHPNQIKSAVGNRGTFDPNEPDITKADGGDVEPDDFNPRAVIGGNNPPTPVYYSALKQGVANAKQMQATPQDWKAITAPGKLSGVRQEEIDYSGLHDFLDTQQGQVSKADLLDHLEQNPAVKLNEAWKSGTTGPNKTKFGQWTLPGGNSYKELAMTLPPRPEGERNYESPVSHSYGDDDSDINRLAHIRMIDRVGPNGEKLLHIEELQSDWHQTGLNEGYFDPEKQKQIDYHNGERRRITGAYEAAIIPHLDAFDAAIKPHQDAYEAAKDRHQDVYSAAIKPHRGAFDAAIKSHEDAYDAAIKPHQDASYAAIKPHQDAYDAAIKPHEDAIKSLGPNKGVPDAPYKDTKDWTALALKRVMRHAANNNYDGITWTTGDQQADRYDLSKQVSSIKADLYTIANENGWRLNVKSKNGDSIPMPGHYLSDDELADHVGKDMAKKIIDSNGGEFHGLDLKVGGGGMRKYYDEIVPSVAKELAKAHGVKVGKIQMKPANKPNYAQWAYDYQQENGSQNQGHLDDAYDDFVDSKESKDLGELHYLPVTSSMKKSAKLFKSGGMVEPYKHTGVIHPARMISGVHIRHETHGTPIFTGGKHGR